MLKALAKARSILLRDGKDAVTALRATGPADEVMTTAFNGGGEGGVYDLGEGLTHEQFALRHILLLSRFRSTKRIAAL